MGWYDDPRWNVGGYGEASSGWPVTVLAAGTNEAAGADRPAPCAAAKGQRAVRRAVEAESIESAKCETAPGERWPPPGPIRSADAPRCTRARAAPRGGLAGSQTQPAMFVLSLY